MVFNLSWLDPDIPFDAGSLHTFRSISGLHEFRVDLSTRPVTKDVGPGRISAAGVLVISSLLAAAPLFKLLTGEPLTGFLVLFLIASVVIFAIALRPALAILRRRRIATFTRLDVHVVEPDGPPWRCGYRHFLGVQQKTLTLRYQRRDVTFVYVELEHEDRGKNLLLHATTRELVEGDPVSEYAAALGVPVLGRDGVGDG